MDELNANQDNIAHEFFSNYIHVLGIWVAIYFCCVSPILIIKHDPESKIPNTYMHQLNLTISSVFTGLLDYITDILLIFYWIHNELYVFAVMELLFIIVSQIMSSLLIKDVPHHAALAAKQNNTEETTKSARDWIKNILISCIFCLGFSRVYHSLKKWNGSKYYEYEYKWCKLWEIMYESIPSVVLSTYVTLMEITNTNNNNNKSVSISVIVSMLFSFVSITNIIVSILNKDSIHVKKQSHDEAIANQIIMIGTNSTTVTSSDESKQASISNISIDSNQKDLWTTDEVTGEVSFFAEKVKPRPHKSSNKKTFPFEKECNKCLIFIFHFDIKIKNFMIWLFLTTDLFLKTLSILSIMIFVNYLFVNNANSNSMNFNTMNMTNDEIVFSILSTFINVIFLFCLLLIEYRLFKYVLQNDGEYISIKYFMIGVFSNFFYFLSTIGLEYLMPLITQKQFTNNQIFRILISCVFVCILLLLQSLFDKWIFDWAFYLIFVTIVLLNVMCLWYNTRYVFATS